MTKPQADLYILQQVPWQYFCTLTFPDLRRERGARVTASGSAQAKLLFAFLRQAGRALGADWSQFLWMTRREQGELTGRDHFHALLGGSPSRPARGTAFKLMHLWESLSGGHARVRVFKASLDAVGYVLKGVCDDQSSEAKDGLTAGTLRRGGTGLGADRYESQKFARAVEVEIAKAVFVWILERRGHAVIGDRRDALDVHPASGHRYVRTV